MIIKASKYILPHSIYSRLNQSDIARRIANGAMWNILGTGVSRIFFAISIIFVARFLGKTAFGQFSLIQASFSMIGMIAGFGLADTATRFVAQYSMSEKERVAKTIVLIHVASFVIVTLVLVLFLFFSSSISIYILKDNSLQQAFICGTFGMAINIFRSVQSAVLAGLERFDSIAKLNVLEAGISLILVLFLVSRIYLVGAIIAYVFASTVVWLIGTFVMFSELRSKGISLKINGFITEFNIVKNYSFPNLLTTLIASPVLWLCTFLLSKKIGGYEELAVFNAAYQLHGPLIFIPLTIMGASLPILVKEWVSGSKKTFQSTTIWMSIIVFLIALPIALFLSVFSKTIMSLYGTSFKEGYLVLVFVLLAAPFHATSKIASSALQGMCKPWYVFYINIFWSIIILALSLLLIPIYGALGLSLAFFISYALLAVFSIVLVYKVSEKLKKINEYEIVNSFGLN